MIMRLIVALTSVIGTLSFAYFPDYQIEITNGCNQCNLSLCTQVTECPMGYVKDRCECCQICALEEFHRCNSEEELILLAKGISNAPWYGRCGIDLVCRAREDVDKEFRGSEFACECQVSGISCGSDGITYSHCQMLAVESKSNRAIYKINDGPCKTEPRIINTSTSKEVFDKSKITIVCEVEGYPKPQIFWYFMPPNEIHKRYDLPGYSEKVSVTSRGGAQLNRIVSYLQIYEFELSQQGTYECFAQSDFGVDRRNISIIHKSAYSPIEDELVWSELGWIDK